MTLNDGYEFWDDDEYCPYDDDEGEDEDLEDEEEYDDEDEFADPGGNSALRAATSFNPRNQPCPTCGAKNALTPRDVALHYQCDRCADKDEGGMVSWGQY